MMLHLTRDGGVDLARHRHCVPALDRNHDHELIAGAFESRARQRAIDSRRRAIKVVLIACEIRHHQAVLGDRITQLGTPNVRHIELCEL